MMHLKKVALAAALTVTSILTVSSNAVEDSVGKWESIFNGKNLEGWTVKMTGLKLGEDPKSTYRVENGLLRVSYDQYAQFNKNFGNLYYNKELSHYRLRFDYRFIGNQIKGGPKWAKRNSGVMIHAQAPSTMTIDQFFPVSIESQLLGGLGKKERTTGNVCSPDTHFHMKGNLVKKHCVTSSSKTFHGDQWVRFEIEVRGDKMIRHFVNGEQVFEFTKPVFDLRPKSDAAKLMKGTDPSLKRGYISLQAESHSIDFRNIELMQLDQ